MQGMQEMQEMQELLTQPLELFLVLFPAIVLLLWVPVILHLLTERALVNEALTEIQKMPPTKKARKYPKSTS